MFALFIYGIFLKKPGNESEVYDPIGSPKKKRQSKNYNHILKESNNEVKRRIKVIPQNQGEYNLELLRDLLIRCKALKESASIEDMLKLRGVHLQPDFITSTDLGLLSQLSNLKSLRIEGDLSFKNLDSISELPLETLYLNGVAIEDYSSINKFTKLKDFEFILNSKDSNTDFSFLSGLPELSVIYLKGDSVKSLSLNNIPNLTHLNLADSSIKDISNLNNLPSLVLLSGNEIETLGEISKFTRLESLYMPNSLIDSSVIFSELINLRRRFF